MHNFTTDNPVIVHFGQGVLRQLPQTLSQFGSKVLLLYGQGSIKKNGLYQKITTMLQEKDLKIIEYSGILPNPRYQHVDAAARLAAQEDVDVILAVGGGSVLDSAKMVAVTAPIIDEQSSWDFFLGKGKKITSAVPLVTVLTVAATGSEMNMFSVVQNDEQNYKLSFANPFMYPAHSFLDPNNTLSVNAFHTASGVADVIAHCLENYFSIDEADKEATLTDRLIESIIIESILYGEPLLQNLQDVLLREKIMYAAMMALNGMTLWGKAGGDWGVHALEHSLSALYNITHGAGLAVIYPHWLAIQARENPQVEKKVRQLGERVFAIKGPAAETAASLRKFFDSLKLPATLKQLGVENPDADAIFTNVEKTKAYGKTFPLSPSSMKELIAKIL